MQDQNVQFGSAVVRDMAALCLRAVVSGLAAAVAGGAVALLITTGAA